MFPTKIKRHYYERQQKFEKKKIEFNQKII